MSWADMRQLITGRYGEVEIGGGQVNGSLTVVVFASIEGQTFTIVSRDASNWSCMLAVGSGWEPGANPALPVPETSL
ncbi:hypothetical protein DLM20_25210 [Salmonella enterica subsp. enterica serovar Java]|nr:hypothetical protein [Salmonella enterica subsp. enterica serovar Java]